MSRALARQIWDAVLLNLRHRSLIESWWDKMEPSVRAEIERDITEVISRHLPAQGNNEDWGYMW